MFPEGTDFTEETKQKSDDYALKNNFKVIFIYLKDNKNFNIENFIFRCTNMFYILELQDSHFWPIN